MFNEIQDKKITFGLSNFLQEFTSEHDVLNIVLKECSMLGPADIKAIIERQVKVGTEEARMALEKLAMIAISNCKNKIEYCETMVDAFEGLIKEKQERIKKENSESWDK